jgi:rod shape-determining protein MreD
MVRNIAWAFIVVVAALIQTTWPDFLKIQGVVPEVVLMLVVYFAIAAGEERAMFTGALGGLYQDVSSMATLGHHVICLVIVGYAVGRVSTRLVTEHPAVKAGLVFIAGVAQGVLHTIITDIQEPTTLVMTTILSAVIPASFYTALITPFVFVVMDRIFGVPDQPQGSAA